MVKQLVRAMLVVSVGTAGCAKCESKPGPSMPQPTPRAGGSGCDDPGGVCPTNAAQVNGYPIEALHLGGEPNGNGVYIVADDENALVHPGKHRLGVENGQFIARNRKTGEKVLHGKGMKGRWFELHVPLPQRSGKQQIIRVTITKVAKVSLFPNKRPGANDNEGIWAYQLELEGSPPVDPFLCPLKRAWIPQHLGGHPPNGKSDGKKPGVGEGKRLQHWTTAGHFAVLVKGETYDDTRATVVQGLPDPENWFNIACSGTALAKMRLLGLDPEETQTELVTTWQQRQATLKMLTARYCPDRPDKSYTVTGQPLIWQNADKWFEPDRDDVGEVEALWNENGAMCLNTPRRELAFAGPLQWFYLDPLGPRWTREDVVKECPWLEHRRCRVNPLTFWGGILGRFDSFPFPNGAEWGTALYRRPRGPSRPTFPPAGGPR